MTQREIWILRLVCMLGLVFLPLIEHPMLMLGVAWLLGNGHGLFGAHSMNWCPKGSTLEMGEQL